LKDSGITHTQSKSAGKLLAKLHNIDIAHGDFTPANLISSGNKLYLIDFGLSESTNSIEEKALDLLLMRRHMHASLYRSFIDNYAKAAKQGREITARLAKIEERGRYQTRTLS
ncbi:MAG: Kae1-associated serine/threonine protein kinase, partial [Candidatus Micrarchaeota archaeon]|nr:Kae1-associated serine/threonine protein kinase [Candidatus Micrarchaeota archaeon]